MGLSAVLIGFGVIDESIRDHLDYDKSYYENVKNGTFISSYICMCGGSESSRDLANVLGFDPWNFGKHFIYNRDIKKQVKMSDFKELFPEESKIFSKMAKLGWNFIYFPNG